MKRLVRQAGSRLVHAAIGLLHRVGWALSAEWALNFVPNGGGAVVFRTVVTGAWIIFAAVGLEQVFDESRSWQPSLQGLLEGLRGLDDYWPATVWGATYLAFYARFSSQWSYLANLYNQIKQVEVTTPRQELASASSSPNLIEATAQTASPALAQWKAGFVEDAIDLHLALKPNILCIVLAWASEPAVHDCLQKHGPRKTKERFNALRQHQDWQKAARDLGLTNPPPLRLPRTGLPPAT